MEAGKCKDCGAEILWALTAGDGVSKAVPLDPKPEHRYFIQTTDKVGRSLVVLRPGYLDHRTTCKKEKS